MLAGTHMDPLLRPFCANLRFPLPPASRAPLRRRGLSALVAARKAAAEAPSAATDTASTQRQGSLPYRSKDVQRVPSWMAWDRDALQEEAKALERFQVRTPAVPAVVAHAWSAPQLKAVLIAAEQVLCMETTM